MNSTRRLLWLMLPWITIGCAGYRLGSVPEIPDRSIAVLMFCNDSLQPQAEARIAGAIVRCLQSTGTLCIETPASADIIVSGRVIKTDQIPLRFSKTDVGIPTEYRLSVTVRLEAKRTRNNAVVLPSVEITGHADLFLGNDLQTATTQALPLAADDIARQVVKLLVERW